MTGQVIDGKFEILEEIGHGGMGTVYRARQISLDRIVALKMLSASLVDDEEFRNRFRQEAKIIACLTHPNILHVYDIFDQGGAFWIVMEYLEGRSLRDVLREFGFLPIEQAVRIASQVAHGLAYAHAKGIIHRDIKPDNVMIAANDQVKIMDFGIAYLRGSSIHTETGRAMGTPQFMSPEQASGKPVDARSDLYSLAVVLYRMITGELPFTADSPVAIALKHVQEAPRRPSEINPAIPPALDTVLLKAMAKKPAERFQTADEFREMLTRPDLRVAAAAASSPEETFVSTPVQPIIAVEEVAPSGAGMTSTPVILRATRRRSRWIWIAATAPGLLALVLVLGVFLLRREWLPGGRRTYSVEEVAKWPLKRQMPQFRYWHQNDPTVLFDFLNNETYEHPLQTKIDLAIAEERNQRGQEAADQLRKEVKEIFFDVFNRDQKRNWSGILGIEETDTSASLPGPQKDRANIWDIYFEPLSKTVAPNPGFAKSRFNEAHRLEGEWDKSSPRLRLTALFSPAFPYMDSIAYDTSNALHRLDFVRFLVKAKDQPQINTGLRAKIREVGLGQIAKIRSLSDAPNHQQELDNLEKSLQLTAVAPASTPQTIRPGFLDGVRGDSRESPDSPPK